jgi:hypothetical protein
MRYERYSQREKEGWGKRKKKETDEVTVIVLEREKMR